MKFTKKIATTALLAVSLFSASVPTLASHQNGGNWSRGCNNNPWDWGAFSNYYHPYRFHWSHVIRSSDGKKKSGENHAGHWSHSFINTRFGEHVDFDYGFYAY